ncbi:S-adenosyl-L-methionine-dependent methyltransferase [Mycena galopus ATCC 62051]|nr:S-adenosyl-L-methionine-dependent methyltransferase [Mycena galopus ATCC 62051]KAF8215434.1 S-adenosyl-L-methionine-dependent methyltransferase [Mycena galopus ATCC 62051]
MESISVLRRLASIITDSVTAMERVYARSEMPLPSLDAPFNPQDPAEALRQDPEVSSVVKNLVAAAAQISATVSDPMGVAVNTSHAFHLSSALLAVSDLNVVEILREAGPKGADAKDIAAPGHVNPGLMARMLRLLATHHIFQEVSPGVFANNRISSTLDKGKPSCVLYSNRADRLTGSSGVAAFAEHTADIGGKSAVYLSDSLSNPKGLLPFNVAYRTDEGLFTWFEGPENSYNVSRFAVAMKGTTALEPADLIFQGFDWSLLPHQGTVVDVGGGTGHQSMTIAKRYPHLRVVVQDLGSPIELAKAYWKECFPVHINNKMVDFNVHNFFTPQLIKSAAVFLLRHILHDWPDDRVVVILGHLRAAALPTTRLVIIEKILPFASHEDVEASRTKRIPGASRPTAEFPLLPNWGAATADLYLYDLTMHVLAGGMERTLEGFWDVLAQSGWKLVEVHHCRVAGSQLSQLIASPV